MIRVRKSSNIPPSLLVQNCSAHDGQDVQEALMDDSYKKCYLCEQYVNKSFQVEHHKGQAQNANLKYEWTNLFLSCLYCNQRKSGGYDLVNPLTNNIEDLIIHRLDLTLKNIVFIVDPLNVQGVSTVRLLERLFNGKNGIRDVKCKELYEDLQREYVTFLTFLLDYKQNNTLVNKQKIIDSLLISKEFLAFKYWIIIDDPLLFNEFRSYMSWNK